MPHHVTSLPPQPLRSILVLGAGTAGLLAALALRKKLPRSIAVTVLRSPDIGIIGVGEGTTPNFPSFLYDFLDVDPEAFFRQVHPIWKRGIHFVWGDCGSFPYGFGLNAAMRDDALPHPNGWYAWDKPFEAGLINLLMQERKLFLRGEDGRPVLDEAYGYHLENELLARWLEEQTLAAGVVIVDGRVVETELCDWGVRALTLEDGRHMEADMFVDASGFRSELLGKALGERFVPATDTLFCDRAVVGGWARGADEPIQPWTTAETMPSGWAWRIDHEHHINRGYVYCSAFVSDEQAEADFRAANPKVTKTRVVRFSSGHYERSWVGNVVAVGNAAGFVEPMEATGLMILCMEIRAIVGSLQECGCLLRPSLLRLHDKFFDWAWTEVKDFIGIHYKFNNRLDTPFWRHCREKTPLGVAEDIVAFYQENGPSFFGHQALVPATSSFGLEGWWSLLIGQSVPWTGRGKIPPAEMARWEAKRQQMTTAAANGVSVEEMLQLVRSPGYFDGE